MGEMSQANLLREIQSLSERLREQDRQLLRFKEGTRRGPGRREPPPRKGRGKKTGATKGGREPADVDPANTAGSAGPAGPGDAAIKHWAGVFAHEMNQPLAAILTTAQACRGLLASGKVLPAEMLQGMETLIRRAHHAADVVRRLRILAGGEPPRRLPADLRELVRRGLDLLQGPLEESGTKLTLDFAVDFPAVSVDAVQIVQVVVNLARNAIEAMGNLPAPRRQLTVRAQFDSREATVAVEDRGVGLSVDMIQRLFQPLASAKANGMGLGLAVCRQIVEAHRGRIWAKGNNPQGSIFTFTLPLETEES
jgi:two-component system sensor kinase FixL